MREWLNVLKIILIPNEVKNLQKRRIFQISKISDFFISNNLWLFIIWTSMFFTGSFFIGIMLKESPWFQIRRHIWYRLVSSKKILHNSLKSNVFEFKISYSFFFSINRIFDCVVSIKSAKKLYISDQIVFSLRKHVYIWALFFFPFRHFIFALV